MTWAYYNEIEPYCAQWLRNLIVAGHIPAGEIDERDIREVRADDLKGFGACHFFAGIGGWPYAGRLAGIPDDQAIWTGSCPCQPLSSAGQRKGHTDERHLWPAFHVLIAQRRPAKVFGEQVASKDGREWLAGIRADLEHLGYAVGAADLSAAGVGAPQIRQRLWWVADARLPEPPRRISAAADNDRRGEEGGIKRREPTSCGSDGGLAGSYGGHPGPEGLQRGGEHGQQPQDGGVAGRMGNAEGAGLAKRERDARDDQKDLGEPEGQGSEQAGGAGGLVNTMRSRRNQQPRNDGIAERARGQRISQPYNDGGICFWSDFDLIPCTDGKARRVEPGTFPLAHGVPARVGKLRAYGNAIVPQVAAEFMRCCP